MTNIKNLPPLILASASPRRAELLREAGLHFVAIPVQLAEVHPEHLAPREVAQINAYRKSRAVAKKHPDALVLGADTIVCLGDEIFGKPHNLEEAERMLQKLQGRSHQVITGVCLLNLRAHRERLFSVSTAVTFRELSISDIRAYLAMVNPMDKAGAYAIQEHGDKIVAHITGSFTNVVGLPMEKVLDELVHWQQ